MKIHLKTMGDSIDLLLRKALHHENALAVCEASKEELEWEFGSLPKTLMPSDCLHNPENPTVLIIEADDSVAMRALISAQNNLPTIMTHQDYAALTRCPVVLIFKHVMSLIQYGQLPEFVTDWMFASNVKDELAVRLIGAVRKGQTALHFLPHHASLTLVPATRTMIFENASARLTPAEFTLLELFLNNIGSIISLQELVQTFRENGKSAEANNIRVAIYQLRLKLDTLTKSQMPLTSVYRQGYCLRQKSKSKPMQVPVATTNNRYGAQSSA